MSLVIKRYNIESVQFGGQFELERGSLILHKKGLTDLILQTSGLQAQVDLAFPGEATRIINALDSVAPITKGNGGPGVFPGFLSPPRTVGFGVTHLLSKILVLGVGEFPQQVPGVLSPRQGLIEMRGAGAPYSAGSDHINVVLSFSAPPAMSNVEFAQNVRKAMLCVAKRLADLTLTKSPAEIEEYDLETSSPDLPRVAYICQLQNQGPLVETFLCGFEFGKIVPTAINPLETLDGAMVSGNFKSFMKIPTYLHCRNPVILELCKRHGKDFNFVAVILTRGHNESYELKERSAYRAAQLAKLLRCDGVILTMEGTGNAMIDYMLTVQACEQGDVRVVGIIHEKGGPDGREFPLVDFVSEAGALVSSGGTDFSVALPASSKVIGGDRIKLAGLNDPVTVSDSLLVSINDFYGSYQAMAINGFRAFDF